MGFSLTRLSTAEITRMIIRIDTTAGVTNRNQEAVKHGWPEVG